MTQLPADPLLELLVELRDMKQRMGVLISLVSDEIIAQAGERPPLTHAFAEIRQSGIPCCSDDDPPSRDVETFVCLICGTTTPMPHRCPAFR